MQLTLKTSGFFKIYCMLAYRYWVCFKS